LLEGVSLEWQGGERLRNFARRLRESTYTQVAPVRSQCTDATYQLEGLSWMQTLRELGLAVSSAMTWGWVKRCKPWRTC
jgi:hypothetical protein